MPGLTTINLAQAFENFIYIVGFRPFDVYQQDLAFTCYEMFEPTVKPKIKTWHNNTACDETSDDQA